MYSLDEGQLLLEAAEPGLYPPADSNCTVPFLADFPDHWQVIDAAHADFTGDGLEEYALLVWRPWLDWPLMQWQHGSSPVVKHHDKHGDSCHIILTRPAAPAQDSAQRSYDLIWAGSPMAEPITHIAAADLDLDGRIELAALESSYQLERDAPALSVSVWRWNGFGFTLVARSAQEQYSDVATADIDGDGTSELLVK